MEVRIRLLQRGFGPQAGYGEKIFVEAEVAIEVLGRGERDGSPQLGAIRPVEIWLCDADDLVRLLVEQDGTSEDAGIATEAAFPGAIRKDYFVIRIRLGTRGRGEDSPRTRRTIAMRPARPSGVLDSIRRGCSCSWRFAGPQRR